MLSNIALQDSPDSMKYFEVEESESSEGQDAGEEKPTVVDVIPGDHHQTYHLLVIISSVQPDVFRVISQLRHLEADLLLLGHQELKQGGEVVGHREVNI